MLSQVQMGSITKSKQAMPENVKFDGPGELEVSSALDKFAANRNTPLPKPGFNS